MYHNRNMSNAFAFDSQHGIKSICANVVAVLFIGRVYLCYKVLYCKDKLQQGFFSSLCSFRITIHNVEDKTTMK